LTSGRKRPIADEQTLLKICLPDVKITSNRIVLSGKRQLNKIDKMFIAAVYFKMFN